MRTILLHLDENGHAVLAAVLDGSREPVITGLSISQLAGVTQDWRYNQRIAIEIVPHEEASD